MDRLEENVSSIFKEGSTRTQRLLEKGGNGLFTDAISLSGGKQEGGENLAG